MRKRKVFMALALVLALFFLVMGCGSRMGSDSADGGALAPGYDNRYPGEAPPKSDGDYSRDIGDIGSGEIGQRYSIRTGEVSVNVESIKDSEAKIRWFVESKGGFIASSNFYSNPRGDYQNSYLTVRVPQEHFDATMLFLEEDLGKLTHKISGDSDVTLQYVDMEARINNLTRQETRYTEILDQAKTVEEILQIERELVRIRGDIESLSAQFINLRDRVSLATISISLQQTVTAVPGVTTVGFEGAWGRAIAALTETLNTMINGTANLFVYSFRVLPYLILILAGLFLTFAVLKRFDRRQRSQ